MGGYERTLFWVIVQFKLDTGLPAAQALVICRLPFCIKLIADWLTQALGVVVLSQVVILRVDWE